MLSTKRSDTARRRISLRPAAPPYGGVSNTLGRSRSGLSGGSGSCSYTSRQAPAMRRVRTPPLGTGGDVHIVVAGAGLDHRQPRRPAQKGIVHPDVLRDHPRPHSRSLSLGPPPRSPQKPSSPPESSRRSAPWSPPETCRSRPLSRTVTPFPAYSTGSFPGAQDSPGRTGAVGAGKIFP